MAENEEPQSQAAETANVEQELERVASAAERVSSTAQSALVQNSRTLDVILDVLLQVTVEVGRARMTIQDLLQLGQGSVIELEKLAGEPLDVYINGKLVAKGEAVILNEKFGVRVLDVISKEDRVQTLST